MTSPPVPERVQQNILKNLSTSYGLTLVAGLPFSDALREGFAQVQSQLEQLAPGCFTWYHTGHLHTTLLAPLRGRYRESPPLRRDELPADLDRFVHTTGRCFESMRPFSLTFDRLLLTSHGLALALAPDTDCVRRRVAACLQPFPELDPPKHLDEWHVTLGYLRTTTPFASEDEQTRFEAGLARLQDGPPLQLAVDGLWLVHYANRMLDRIVGRVALALGRPNFLDPDLVLADLGIDE
jgi:hypothetical protein